MRRLLLLFLLITLPACTEVELASHVAKQIPIPNEKKSEGYFKVGNPYRIAGQKYYPQESYSFTETGIASWYGPNFHGKKTANGEIFDKYELTAAHRTLQMPSLARVTNLENGRSIVVRINDRGPFKKNRIIDLSERGAELLDFKHKGTAKVKVEVLEEESRKLTSLSKGGHDVRGFEIAHQNARNPIATPAPKPTKALTKRAIDKGHNVYVQAGAFGNKGNALAMADRVREFGRTKISETLGNNGSPLYRVRLGPFRDAPKANTVLSQLASTDIPSPIIVVE